MWELGVSKRVRYAVVGGVAAIATGVTSLVVLKAGEDFAELPELVQARETGKPVEVQAQHTQVQRTWANPNGTFRREYSAFPKWVKTKHGWKNVDYTLAKGKDGLIAPKAAPDSVTFGGGGDKFLMSMKTGGVKIRLAWPAALPEPTLEGAVATYADVVPDVDLKLTVDAGGPKQVLVVKNAEAAANPALRQFALGAKIAGGSMGGLDGGLRVLDARGREVAVAPRPQMWDSSGDVVDMKMQPVVGASADSARVFGPGRGDKVAAVKLDVAPDRLMLSPKASLLQGDDVTYPVFIDPQIAPPKFDWAMVKKQSPSTVYYKWSGSNNAEWVGSAGSGYTQRLFWKYEVADLAYADLTKATFTATARGSENCSSQLLSVWRTNPITPGTDWNDQPGPIGGSQKLDQRNAATGKTCTYPNRALEFDVEDGAQAAAYANRDQDANGVVKLTLRLTADDEERSDSWVWIDRDATLSIVYSFPPEKPTGLAMVDPDATCQPGSTVKIGTLAPRASATVASLDLDNDNLRMEFQAFAGPTIEGGEARAWSEDAAGTSGAGGGTVVAGTRFVSATRITGEGGVPLPAGEYVWRARAVKANDPSRTGPWSALCVFQIVDNVLPTPGVEVLAGTVWQVDDDVNVTIKPTETGTTVPANVAYYRWSLNSTSAANQVVIPATSTNKRVVVPIKPDRAGPNTLRVWAYDVHGNRSAPQVLTFDTSAGVGTFSARYLLNEQPDAASVFSNAVGTNPLVAAPSLLADRGTYRVEGPPESIFVDKLLHLSGSNGPVTSTSTALDTSKAFTVSAWVDAQLPASGSMPDMTAVSQGTNTQSAFVLGVGPCTAAAPAVKCYRFGVRGSNGTYTYVTSNRTVIQDALGTSRRLVHLVGSVSATGKLRLYVFADGTIEKTAGSVTRVAITSTAPLVIGAERASSAYTGRWVGNIDNVTVMTGALDGPAAVQLHAKDDERCYKTHSPNDDGLKLCAD